MNDTKSEFWVITKEAKVLLIWKSEKGDPEFQSLSGTWTGKEIDAELTKIFGELPGLIVKTPLSVNIIDKVGSVIQNQD